MQYSIATVCLSGTLRQKIEAIAKAGFQGIEIFENDLITHDGSLGELRQLLADYRLKVLVYQPFRDFEGMPEPLRHPTGGLTPPDPKSRQDAGLQRPGSP